MAGDVIGSDGKRYIAHLLDPKAPDSLIAQPGDLIWYPKSSIPAYCLLANGNYYSPAAYPALFHAIGYAFGKSGVNFRVPEIVDFIRPYDQVSNLFTAVQDEVGRHGHGGGSSGSGGSHNHTVSFRDWVDRDVRQKYKSDCGMTTDQGFGRSTITFSASGNHSHGASASGGGGAETFPQHVIMALCVCAQGTPMFYTGA